MTLSTGFAAKVLLSRLTPWAIAVVAGLSVSACNRPATPAQPVGQVVAHVGPDDVTLQELQNEMRVLNIPIDKQKEDAVVKAVLSEIVSRKYVVQQAIGVKLDRQPTILLDLIRAREQVLGGAFIQRQSSEKLAGVGKGEIDSFIQAHPKQFGSREVFNIDQISFEAPKDMNEVIAVTKELKDLDQVEAKLNELGVKHVRHPGAIDGGTLPENLIAQLKAQKADDVFLLRAGDGATFFRIVDIKAKPVTGDDALRLAKRAIQQENLKALAADTEKAAVASAKFEGDYGRIMAGSNDGKK